MEMLFSDEDTRELDYSFSYIFSDGNTTDDDAADDFDSANLSKPEDVTVDAVISSLFFNTLIFVFLMMFYEMLRCLLPTVYSSRKKLHHMRPERDEGELGEDEGLSVEQTYSRDSRYTPPESLHGNGRTPDLRASSKESISSLPDDSPLDWVAPVFGVPWSKVRKIAGLDGYFFLRYIRMNVRITAVSTFWFFLILVPIYITGNGNPEYPAQGWYHISASNLPSTGWRMWAPVVFAYLFSSFIAFVIKQEYKHFLDLRQDFLAKGCSHVNPQHHYSLMIENIPTELRSERALEEYFENLLPGRVHSASVVMNVPDLQDASTRCMRTCRRLEKSIALLYATGKRPSHRAGKARLTLLGVDIEPLDIRQCTEDSSDSIVVDADHLAERPRKGTRVDSISYYTQELAAHSRALFRLQSQKERIAESGNLSVRAENWFDSVFQEFSEVANQIMDDSILDNDLISPNESVDGLGFRHAENMTSRYGSFGNTRRTASGKRAKTDSDDRSSRLTSDDFQEADPAAESFKAPFSEDRRHQIRRWAGRFGLDFVIAIVKAANKQLSVTLEGVVGETMSSTGFVTFLDLSSTTCAASAPLSAKSSVLSMSVAPEPREIIWENCAVSQDTRIRRESVVNFVLFLGVILWSFPLAAIQAFAKAKYLAQIPGMEWILTFNGGALTQFVNGYLPVVGLLGLILILPVLFQLLALKFERRKTFSDVQSSMLARYFNYQLANIYVTVTAGSILKSLSDILNRPSNILPLLGESLPTMVGYFIALLVTKIMAGLPMVFLRFGALSRMLFLKMLANEPKLTQRELDAVYRLENVQYGWEFPTQLMVVVIVFTYAIICPIILPFGLVYFVGALIVYKKQILYVYSPVYESGGAMFPMAVQRTMFGLVCGQLTLLGYTVTRAWYYQNFALMPLPFLTVFTMRYFQRTYVDPSSRLSLERAREHDRHKNLRASRMADVLGGTDAGGRELMDRHFDKNAYRQPVLTELATEPWTYRRGIDDDETMEVRSRLRHINRFATRVAVGEHRRNEDLSSPDLDMI